MVLIFSIEDGFCSLGYGSNKNTGQKHGFKKLLQIGEGFVIYRDRMGYHKLGQVNLLLIGTGNFNTNHEKCTIN